MRSVAFLASVLFSICLVPSAARAQCATPVLDKFLDALNPGPTLWTPDGAPVVNGPFSLAVKGGLPGRPGLLILSTVETPAYFSSLGVLYPGLTGALTIGFALGPDGSVSSLMAVPSMPILLCGVQAVAQAAVKDPSAPLGVALSNALRLRVGVSPGLVFSQETHTQVGETPRGIAAADFNGDGETDLAIADTASHDAAILLGLGDGSFASSLYFPVGQCPGSMVTTDLDNDGKEDLVLANGGSDDVSVLLGIGDGSFAPVMNFPAGSGPRAAVAADFNGDGFADVAVANFTVDLVSILLGNGDGTLAAATNFPVFDGPFDLATADLDADGHADLVAAGRNSDDVLVLLGLGNGTFQTPLSFACGDNTRAVDVVDVDGDGVLDVVAANWSVGNVALFRGLGDGSLLPAVYSQVLPQPAQLEHADLNGDGFVDVIVSYTGGTIVTFLHGSGGGLAWAGELQLASTASSVLMRDVDSDGIADLVTAGGPGGAGGCPAPTGLPGQVSVLLNLLGE